MANLLGKNWVAPRNEARKLLGWDATGTAMQNYSAADIAEAGAVASVAALRLLTTATYSGSVINLLSWYAGLRKGGGFFHYDASDTTTADNSCTVIVDANGRRWKLLHDGTVSISQCGAKVDGATDDLAAINVGIAALNAGTFPHLYFDGGTTMISAALTAITASGWAITGAGMDASHVKMQSGAGTAGTFFTVGTDATSAAKWQIAGLSLTNDNYATLDGTKPQIMVANAVRGLVHNIYSGNNGGFIKLGNGTGTANQISVTNIRGLARCTVPSRVIDLEACNTSYFDDIVIGANGSPADANFISHRIKPRAGETCDSNHFSNVEWNFPSDAVTDIMVLDCTGGTVVNSTFINVICDHANGNAIKLLCSATPNALAKMRNIFFYGCRATSTSGSSGVYPVQITNTGDVDFTNILFHGGLYSAWDVGVFSISGVAASLKNNITIADLKLSDRKNGGASKSAIVCNVAGLVVSNCLAQVAETGNTMKFGKAVEFTADVASFKIVHNDFASCLTTPVIDTALLTTGNALTQIIRDNAEPNPAFPFIKTTTDATVTVVKKITLTDNMVYQIKARVLGWQNNLAQRASYEISGTFYRAGGGATLVGAVTNNVQESNAAWDATLAVNGNDVELRVTGVAAVTIRWSAALDIGALG